jgi:exopolysaccharide biosynthesis polyprenyl glycosylphosphotransferase
MDRDAPPHRFDIRQLRAASRERVLMLGTGPRARRIAATLEAHPDFRGEVVGFLDDEPREGDLAAVGDLYLGGLETLSEHAPALHVDRVIFALPRRFLASDRVSRCFALCELLVIEVTIPTDFFDRRVATVDARPLHGVPAITLSARPRGGSAALAVKRAFDVAVSALLLALLSPLFVAIAAVIRLDSEGPALFVQERCGLRGRRFPFLKFRTMHRDAEQRLAEIRERNELSGPVFKLKQDPRMTRVGRFLRRYSLDELPQLANVLVGHMSLVGPRPPVPSEVARYELDHHGRLSMRPGMTGLWQISGRNEIPFEEWVKLDLEYIQGWSLALDLGILLATIPAVLSGRGAS